MEEIFVQLELYSEKRGTLTSCEQIILISGQDNQTATCHHDTDCSFFKVCSLPVDPSGNLSNIFHKFGACLDGILKC